MAEKIETVHAGFYTEIATRMEGLSVHDMGGFGGWIASDGRLTNPLPSPMEGVYLQAG